MKAEANFGRSGEHSREERGRALSVSRNSGDQGERTGPPETKACMGYSLGRLQPGQYSDEFFTKYPADTEAEAHPNVLHEAGNIDERKVHDRIS